MGKTQKTFRKNPQDRSLIVSESLDGVRALYKAAVQREFSISVLKNEEQRTTLIST